MKYVACYVRVSTDEQKKFGFSIQAQKDALEKFCKENNYKYEFYVDEGISASSMKKRVALKEMLNKCTVFDMILFTKLDRLSRNVLDANNINKILIENHCSMKAIDEDDIDTSTADGTFMFNLKVSLAQREIGKTSERINFVFKNKREKGEVTSGTKKYGYDIVNKHYVINKEEQENLIALYKYCISVNGDIPKIYSYFVQHFSNKGYCALYKYLRDTSYIGKYKLYRKDIYIDNYAPPLMDNNLFYSVQNLLQKKQRNVNNINNNISLFSGLIYCNRCSKRMTKKQDNRVSSHLIRYCCDNVFHYKIGTTEKKCNNSKLIRESDIENYLLENLKIEAQKFITQNQAKPISKTSDNSREIKIIEKKLLKLKDLYIDDLIDKETYKKDYQDYISKLNKLKETNTIVVKKDLTNVKQLLNSDYNIYQKLNMQNKRRFWLSIIDRIFIENGEIKEVTFL